MRENIIISMPLVWGIRNVFYSGLADRLSKHYKIIYAVPALGIKELVNLGVPREDIIELPQTPQSSSYKRVLRILKKAHARMNPTATDKIFGKWLGKDKRLTLKLLIREGFEQVAVMAAMFKPVFRWLEKQEEKEFLKEITPRQFEQLRALKPAFALSTTVVVDWEWQLFKTLKALNVPVFTHILSFDNLTSRGYLPIKYFQHYMVWNDRMAKELIDFYEVPNEKIKITGTPQFDFHVDPAFKWTKEETYNKLGLKDGRDYLLYCGNGYFLTPNEPQLFEHILENFRKDKQLLGYQWVLRLHPMDHFERWNALLEKYPEVTLSLPWQQDKDAIYWGSPSKQDIALFSNTLRYAKGCYNIGSTVSIDACVADLPVVCLGFHPNKGSLEDKTYHDFHFTHHYLPITETGATPLATDINSLISLTKDFISDPARLQPERKNLVKKLCGVVDGHSADRIYDALMSMA